MQEIVTTQMIAEECTDYRR